MKKGDWLKRGNKDNTVHDEEQIHECVAWLTSAQNLVYLITTNTNSPYRTGIDRICSKERDYGINKRVGDVCEILHSLAEDIDAGLISSIENQTRALVFDDFLDHAKAYVKEKRKSESGVIAGVLFEDILRTISRNNGINERDEKLDSLISELVKCGTFTEINAKTARMAAGLRTKATHAQWDEFELADVKRVIDFTDELIQNHFHIR